MKPFSRFLILFFGPFVAVGLGFAASLPWLLPILGAAVAWPSFWSFIKQGQYRRGYLWMLLWAAGQSLAVAFFAWNYPVRAADVILTGPAYSQEMVHWIRTGVGPEGSPGLFLPVHLKHFTGFCVLSLVSLGTVGLMLGTYLLNYMNFYVVDLVRAAAEPGLAAAIGWPAWAVIRVLGYIAAAIPMTVLSLKLMHRLRPKANSTALKFPRAWLYFGLALVTADAVLKAALAPAWREWLLRALSGAS